MDTDHRSPASCPNCDGRGWYVVANRNTGEPEQQQCQWCFEHQAEEGMPPATAQVRCSCPNGCETPKACLADGPRCARPEQTAVVCNLSAWFNMPDVGYQPHYGRKAKR